MRPGVGNRDAVDEDAGHAPAHGVDGVHHAEHVAPLVDGGDGVGVHRYGLRWTRERDVTGLQCPPEGAAVRLAEPAFERHVHAGYLVGEMREQVADHGQPRELRQPEQRFRRFGVVPHRLDVGCFEDVQRLGGIDAAGGRESVGEDLVPGVVGHHGVAPEDLVGREVVHRHPAAFLAHRRDQLLGPLARVEIVHVAVGGDAAQRRCERRLAEGVVEFIQGPVFA